MIKLQCSALSLYKCKSMYASFRSVVKNMPVDRLGFQLNVVGLSQ